ncbi:MAG: hypothetical protein AB3N14_11920 [Flavobacteriaceae bacterium]
MKLLVYRLVAILGLAGCNQNKDQSITHIADYNKYLSSKEPSTTTKYFEL